MTTILSKRLQYIRQSRGLAQKFVASKIGIKANTLSGYESGRREPDSETLASLADFYEVTTDYLLGRSDTPSLSKDEEFNEKHNLYEGVKEVKFREMQEQLKDYSDEEVDELLEWMKFKAEQNRKKRDKQKEE
ncbi:helix-turn-helix domain-containing protein [Marinococcus luteus]|uniref:helix-turn-helix domain-containing protein n=1 Tax=Marinococcus luteus TaxID=1122204 RepID=UPI002ACC5250|nr:helix-turn-helix transcriptional regulator [Marinococcus luteus]MDZ5782072.1 helix-turn-helix transcriptional regulator [Marinococcus luteus]